MRVLQLLFYLQLSSHRRRHQRIKEKLFNMSNYQMRINFFSLPNPSNKILVTSTMHGDKLKGKIKVNKR